MQCKVMHHSPRSRLLARGEEELRDACFLEFLYFCESFFCTSSSGISMKICVEPFKEKIGGNNLGFLADHGDRRVLRHLFSSMLLNLMRILRINYFFSQVQCKRSNDEFEDLRCIASSKSSISLVAHLKAESESRTMSDV